MGNISMQPKIVKIKIPPSTPGGLPTYKWFVAVGSGYNNYVNDGTGRYSLTGDQALFLLSLDKSPTDSWSEGSNYFKIVVPASSSSIANSMANPGLLLGDRGEASVMYSGDLQGNIWKFDFSEGLSSGNISSNKITKATSGVRKPLFTATDDGGTRQPITVSPLVTTALQRGVMVVFGTGKFLEQADAITTGAQSIYGVWDGGGSTNADFNLSRTNLQQQTATEGTSTISISTTAFTLGTGTGEKRGWYFNLPKRARTYRCRRRARSEFHRYSIDYSVRRLHWRWGWPNLSAQCTHRWCRWSYSIEQYHRTFKPPNVCFT